MGGGGRFASGCLLSDCGGLWLGLWLWLGLFRHLSEALVPVAQVGLVPVGALEDELPVLFDLGFPKEDIILSLENRMKCGIGKCGRCNIGPKYVCADGPVFTYAEMEELPPEQ